MADASLATVQWGIAFAAYVVNTASPGPSNMAIMTLAMHSGRRSALVFAAGVMCGSCCWGLAAALGLATLLAHYGAALVVLKLAGGLYLLWLAGKSARQALQAQPSPIARPVAGATQHWSGLWARGAALHLTNPKAVFSWLSVVALGLPVGASRSQALELVAACAALGVLIFGSYALAFSTPTAQRTYAAARRWIHGVAAAVFGLAAGKLWGLYGTT